VTALPQILMAASAFVIGLLGAVHLLYTFRGDRLHPRDGGLQARMHEVSPMLTSRTTMWRAWIGFNASHSLGAMLYGLVYGYLATVRSDVVFGSAFLVLVGFAMLCALLVLARAYWFSVPFRGIALATALYVAAVVARWV